jgi:hypothetical protein
VRSVDQKPSLTGSGDWSRDDRRFLFSTRELDSGAGAIPTTLGEGLRHVPHGSDWSSIREAGTKADKSGTSLDDAASIDGHGYAQEGNETVVTANQRKEDDTLEPKWHRVQDRRLYSRPVFTPYGPRRNFPPYPRCKTRVRNGVTPYRSHQCVRAFMSRCQPDAIWWWDSPRSQGRRESWRIC